MSHHYDSAKLKELAKNVRVDIIKMLEAAQSGHSGGSLSEVEILVALYGHEMNHDPKDPCKADRDRFVISKGHGIPGVYATMANLGYWGREEPMTLRMVDSKFQGHPDVCKLPGMEASTGSLGQGLSIAIGYALAAKLDKMDSRVYCLIGDGESQEGQIWEAAMCAPMYNLDNLVCILDYNKAQIDGYVKDVMNIEPIDAKWESFGWNVIKVDGHDLDQIIAALAEARTVKDKPTFILADTVKGKGVSFMEGLVEWHGVAPTKEQAEQAIEEIMSA